MAEPTDESKLKNSFFHSIGKSMVLNTMDSYESQFKSGHIVQINELISTDLPNLNTESEVDSWISSNPGILLKVDTSLTMIPNTNQQSWYIEEESVWVKPIILNTLVVNSNTNEPSLGYVFRLYEENGNRIGEGLGQWFVNPYQGIVYFDVDTTPDVMGWGIPKVVCYVYIGDTLLDIIEDINNDLLTHTHDRVNTHKITVNDGALPDENVGYDIWITIDS